jgi:hypothetical protein
MVAHVQEHFAELDQPLQSARALAVAAATTLPNCPNSGGSTRDRHLGRRGAHGL